MTDEEKDLRLSVSKSKTFLDCKKKFKFSYILKLPKKEYDYHIYGKFVHRVLELFHLSYINGSVEPQHIEMSNAFKASLEEFKTKLTKEQKIEAKEACSAYLKKISKEDPALTAKVLAVEKEFSLNLSDKLILLGVIDRLQIDHDGILHVCDYKTTKNKKYLKNDWFQLLTYAYVLLMEDPSIKTVRGSYILIRHDFEYITKDFSVEEILAIKDKYLQYGDDINSEKLWRPNPSFLCGNCEFLDNCPEGKDFLNKVKPDKVYGEIKW